MIGVKKTRADNNKVNKKQICFRSFVASARVYGGLLLRIIIAYIIVYYYVFRINFNMLEYEDELKLLSRSSDTLVVGP